MKKSKIRDSSHGVYELDAIMSMDKDSTIESTSTLRGSAGTPMVSSDGSEFPVQEVLGRHDNIDDPDSEAHILTWMGVL